MLFFSYYEINAVYRYRLQLVCFHIITQLLGLYRMYQEPVFHGQSNRPVEPGPKWL